MVTLPHDAFRAAILEMEEILCSSSNKRQRFGELYTNYLRSLQVHLEQEEFDLMPFLDKLSEGGVTESGIHQYHEQDVIVSSKVKELCKDLNNLDWNDFIGAFDIWRKNHLEHFSIEENKWHPLMMKTSSSSYGRCVVVHEKLVTPCYQRNPTEWLFHIAWCTEYISKYGSPQQSPLSLTKTFLRALHSTCSAEQWTQCMPTVKQGTSSFL